MKKWIKKCVAMAAALSMLLGLFASESVFAASISWYHITSPARFERISEQYATISFDVKKNSDFTYMLELSEPGNLNDPYSTVTWRCIVCLMLASNGDMRAYGNGGWLNTDGEAEVLPSSLSADGKWHNLKFRYNNKSLTTDIYLDDVFQKTCDYSGRISDPTVDYFCNMLTLTADSTKRPEEDIEYKVSAIFATEEGELGAQFGQVDEANRTITMQFSEKLRGGGAGAVLRKTDVSGGQSEIPLTALSGSGSSVTFRYDEPLESAQEYALILPDDLEGALGGKLKNNIYYFTAEEAETVDVIQCSDYENYDDSIDVTFPQEASNSGVSEDEGDGYGHSLILSKYVDATSNYTTRNWGGVTGATEIPLAGSGKTEVSFDVKPMRDDLHIAFQFTPLAGVNHNGDADPKKKASIFAMLDMDGHILISGDIASWGISAAEGPFANDFQKNGVRVPDVLYQKGQWLHFRFIFDQTENTCSIYVNNVLARKSSWWATNERPDLMPKYLTIMELTHSSDKPEERTNIGEKGETLLLMDNVQVGTIPEAQVKPTVRFRDMSGAEKGPFATVSRELESVNVTFDEAVNVDSLDDSHVQLIYDGVPVEYSQDEATYDEQTKTWQIKPSQLPSAGGRVEVRCSDVQYEDGSAVSPYDCYVTVDDREGFAVERFGFVGANGAELSSLSGDAYLDLAVVNMTEQDRDVIVSALGYKGGALAQHEYRVISVPAGTALVMDPSREAVSLTAGGLDAAVAMLQDGETHRPLCESVTLGKTAEAGLSAAAGAGSVADGALTALEIYAPGKSFADLETAADFRDVLLYQAQTTAADDGSFAVPFAVDYADAVSGVCKVLAYSDGKDYEGELLYVNPTTAGEVLESELVPLLAAGDADGTAQLLTKKRYDLYLDDKYIDANVAKKAAALLIAYAKSDTLTAQNEETVVNKAVAIAAFEAGKITDVLAEDRIFALKDSAIRDYYQKSYVNGQTRADVVRRLAGNSYKALKDFDTALKDSFLLSVVANPVEPNSAMSVMKGLGLSGYTTAQYAAVTGRNYATVDELEQALKNAGSGSGSNSGSGGGVGGGGSGSKGSSNRGSSTSVSLPSSAEQQNTPQNTPSAPQQSGAFRDLGEVSWAQNAIESLAQKNVLSGKEPGLFYPMDNVTREEFAKMLVTAFEIGGANSALPFADVPQGAWYAEYIARAYSAGIVNGQSESTFGVGENITRQDIAAMLYRAMLQAGITLPGNADAEQFSDNGEIGEYAREGVYALKAGGVINGRGENLFAPNEFATRAEAAKMIYGVLMEK